MKKPLPCPICGETRYVEVTVQQLDPERARTGEVEFEGLVQCLICHLRMPARGRTVKKARKKALGWWNKRDCMVTCPHRAGGPLKEPHDHD